MAASVFAGGLGCEGSPAQARAVWVDRGDDANGGGRLNIYDRGEVTEIPLDPPSGDEGSDQGPITTIDPEGLLSKRLFGLSPRGRGVVTRSRQELTLVDLDEGRRLRVDVPAAFTDIDGDPVKFARNDDALFWVEAFELRVLPFDVEPQLDDMGFSQPHRWTRRARPGEAADTVTWAVSAPRRNLLFAYTISDELVVVRYPSAGDEQAAPQLEELAATPAGGQKLDEPRAAEFECGQLDRCGADFVVDPEGRAVTFVRERRLLRWVWDIDPGFSPVALPVELAADDDPGELRSTLRLAAALDADTYVLFDDARASTAVNAPETPRIIRWRIGEAPTVLPALGAPPFAWSVVADGRGVTLASQAGPAVRVLADRYEVLNTTQTICDVIANRSTVFSPDGRRVAWVCRDPDAEFTDGGLVVRVSPGRFETYLGIPFVALAVDDEGNLLMYSEQATSEDADGADPDFKPRTLYVLGADEVLRRADGLEPVPLAVRIFGEQSTYAFVQGVATR